MSPPKWVSGFQEYWVWLEKLLDESGGYLVNDYLDVQLLGPDLDDPDGLLIHDQRLRFWDESFLEFTIVVNESLEAATYNFHYQDREGVQIWRKDKHEGHEEEARGLAHIHDDPGDPDAARAYEEVDLDEVLKEIHLYQEDVGELL